ncbi:MAG: N-succinylarginine dihydrolase [Phycisphaerae bacterium]|nr:N-succinylarginine dihydrolase [Phycisphaerae bacterium]
MDPALQAKLAELVERMLADSDGPVADPVQRQRLHELRDALDTLRLTVKYLAFDLEATRRENTILRKELAQRKKR